MRPTPTLTPGSVRLGEAICNNTMVRLEAIQLFGPHSILHQSANIVTTRGGSWWIWFPKQDMPKAQPVQWEHADLEELRDFLREEIRCGRYVPTLNLPCSSISLFEAFLCPSKPKDMHVRLICGLFPSLFRQINIMIWLKNVIQHCAHHRFTYGMLPFHYRCLAWLRVIWRDFSLEKSRTKVLEL